MTNTTSNIPKGERSQETKLPAAKWVFLGIVVLAIFVFFAFFAKQFSEASLELNLEDRKVAINTKNLIVSPQETEKRDPNKYYIDSTMGFSFKRPDSKEWLQPQIIKGLEEFLKAKDFSTEKGGKLNLMWQMHPWAPMLTEPMIVRFTTGETLDVEVTEDSSNEVLDEYLKNVMKSEEFQELDLNDEETKEFIRERRSRFFGFNKISFTNEFNIYVYDKQKLAGVPAKHSLANLAILILGPMAMFADQLVADERMVMSGGSFSFTNLRINEEIKDVRIDRLWLFTENKDRYYVVEIGFSPQTKSSLKIWTEMENMVQSFSVSS